MKNNKLKNKILALGVFLVGFGAVVGFGGCDLTNSSTPNPDATNKPPTTQTGDEQTGNQIVISKLQTPTLNIVKGAEDDEAVISWSKVDGAISYELSVNGETQKIYENNSYTLTMTDYGDYDISIKAIGDGKICGDSKASATQTYTYEDAQKVEYFALKSEFQAILDKFMVDHSYFGFKNPVLDYAYRDLDGNLFIGFIEHSGRTPRSIEAKFDSNNEFVSQTRDSSATCTSIFPGVQDRGYLEDALSENGFEGWEYKVINDLSFPQVRESGDHVGNGEAILLLTNKETNESTFAKIDYRITLFFSANSSDEMATEFNDGVYDPVKVVINVQELEQETLKKMLLGEKKYEPNAQSHAITPEF